MEDTLTPTGCWVTYHLQVAVMALSKCFSCSVYVVNTVSSLTGLRKSRGLSQTTLRGLFIEVTFLIQEPKVIVGMVGNFVYTLLFNIHVSFG